MMLGRGWEVRWGQFEGVCVTDAWCDAESGAAALVRPGATP